MHSDGTRGSTFWFTLSLPHPTVESATAAIASPHARALRPAAAGEHVGHILVVDDNPVNQRVAARILEKRGHRVDVVGSGAEAVASVARTPYDAVLMDRQMPGMDGFEATRAIRSQDGPDRHTVIIAMTAGAMTGDEEECLAAGMDAYLSKPVAPDALVDTVEQWIGAKGELGSPAA